MLLGSAVAAGAAYAVPGAGGDIGHVLLVDCGPEYAPSGSRACEDQAAGGVGFFFILTVVVAVAAALWVRRKRTPPVDPAAPAARRLSLLERLRGWPERRRQVERERKEAQARLLEEYAAKYDAGDPDMKEISRDFYDNDLGFPWKAQVLLSAGFLVLFVSVGLLILFFEWIKHLTS